MIAGKLLDALSRIPAFDGQNADALKAHTQASLADFEGDTETRVELPRERRPDSWFKNRDRNCEPLYDRPVVRLLKN